MTSKKTIAQEKNKSQYDPGKIEPRVRKMWERKKLFSPDLNKAKKPYYNLMMFPYPSAEGMHVGNMYAFTGSDIWGRYKRMQGYNVFEPIGLDGFGIHSENYAIKIGEHPVEVAKKTQDRFYEQLHATGNAYDWTRTLETYDPDYYKWTQWLFIQMFKNGLAYREKATVNWCPSCKTVLADEQVVNDHCERCNTKVELKKLEQWFFKITDYAERLLAGLDKIDWPERIKIAQKNWIGKKEGINIKYRIVNPPAGWAGSEHEVECWTSRPDTNFGATFVVLAPEHPLALKIATKENKDRVIAYIKAAQGKSREERIEEGREKTGAATGAYAINDLTSEKMPIWVSDFVLMEFGTGAVVGVPGHDKRDFEFAQKFGLPVKRVVVGADGDKFPITKIEQVQEEEGTMVNSDFLDGMDIHEATKKIMDYLEEKGWGKRVITYHLRDWLISRQRYWGPPIPMIYCEACARDKKGEREDMPGWYPVPEKDLPVELPYIENYRPTGTGESPLAQDPSFVRVNCPECGKAARRETDVSDTFFDSSWYFFRYTSTEDKTCAWKPERVKKWLPVHMYIGGAEHSVLHLMYARFVTMALKDWGLIGFEEPFARFYAHGLLIKDGAKMSKSKGNVVVPDEYIQKYGADTLRMYLMFLGPFDQGGDFRDTGIEGMHRFLSRVWKLVIDTRDFVLIEEKDSREVLQKIHQTIKRVTEDMESLRYNRAIAGIMEYTNSLREFSQRAGPAHPQTVRCAEWEQALQTLVLLLAPFAPHMTEELWSRITLISPRGLRPRSRGAGIRDKQQSVHFQPWPKFDPELAQEEILEIPVQVNGRLRGTVSIKSKIKKHTLGQQKSKIEELARENQGVAKYLEGKKVQKVVFVPGRLINFVV